MSLRYAAETAYQSLTGKILPRDCEYARYLLALSLDMEPGPEVTAPPATPVVSEQSELLVQQQVAIEDLETSLRESRQQCKLLRDELANRLQPAGYDTQLVTMFMDSVDIGFGCWCDACRKLIKRRMDAVKNSLTKEPG